jgi:hypothetical protein
MKSHQLRPLLHAVTSLNRGLTSMTIETVVDICFRIGHSQSGVAISDLATQLILVFDREFLSLIQNENSLHVA